MKKIVTVLLAFVLVASIFAGCGGAAEESKSGLKVAALEGTCGEDAWKQVCKAFTEKTGVEVQLTVYKNANELASVKADVVHSGSASDLVEKLVKDKKLHDLSGVLEATIPGENVKVADKIENGFLESAVTMPYGDGKTYVAPVFYSPWALYYNARLFEIKRWDVPTTWDDMWVLADKALAENIYLFAYYETEDMVSFLSALMYSIGGADFYNAVVNGKEGVWDSKEGRNFVKILDKLAKYTHPEFKGLDDSQTDKKQHLVMHQEALFVPNHTGITTEMLMATQSISNGTFNWGLMALPGVGYDEARYSYCTVEDIWIPADAEMKAEAEQFIAFMYSDEAAQILAAKSALQPIKGMSSIVDSSAKWLHTLFDDGAKAALGNGKIAATLIDSFNQMVDGTIKSSEYIENAKAAAAQ